MLFMSSFLPRDFVHAAPAWREEAPFPVLKAPGLLDQGQLLPASPSFAVFVPVGQLINKISILDFQLEEPGIFVQKSEQMTRFFQQILKTPKRRFHHRGMAWQPDHCSATFPDVASSGASRRPGVSAKPILSSQFSGRVGKPFRGESRSTRNANGVPLQRRPGW
jgi:hypothetical protein